MKKLLLLSSAILLLAGCAKEKFSVSEEGGLMQASFTATMDLGSKAVTDGQGANVNRCVMEIFYGTDDKSYGRYVAKVTSGVATFSNIEVVANRAYKVAFWADCVADATTDAGLGTDQYYDTQSLKAVSFIGTYAGNKDARDAFFGEKEWTPTPSAPNSSITIKRPFAQVNVIATDWAGIKGEELAPTHVNVVLNNVYTTINALDGSLSGATDLTYNAAVYENPGYSVSEATLSMDYLLAATEKAVVDINWEANQGSTGAVAHTFSAVPYQRNYRTNIKGALLSLKGQWTVTVDPIWDGSFTEIVEVKDIKSANAAIAANSSAPALEVKFSAEPNDSGVPTGDPASPSRAILTTPMASGSVLSIEVMTNTQTLYVGDYAQEYNVSATTAANNATVNINVPTGTQVGTLVVNAPFKSVFINGKQVSSVGTITNLDAITSDNTLVIVRDQTVGNLTIRKGGLEIHGTVNSATVIPESGEGQVVFVRDCENLSQAVYDALEPYIAEGYVSVKGKTTPNLWDIVPATGYVAAIGKVGYETLAAAMAAVQENDIVTLLQNIEMTSTLALNVNANYSLNLNGKTISSTADAFNILAGKLTLIGNGTVDTQGTDSKYSFRVANSGKFVIGAENQNYDIVINDLVKSMTETTIWGGTISKVCCFARDGGSKSDVTINGGKIKYLDNVGFSSNECPTTIYLNGGIYGGFEPIPESAKDYCKYVPKEGYMIGDNPDEATKTDYPYALVKAPEYYPGTTIPVVTIDGVVWAPVNCGYDADHKAGLLYQWGRKYGQYTDDTSISFVKTATSTTWAMGNTETNKDTFYYDDASWYYNPDAITVWPDGYDPCPSGWRVPSESEVISLVAHHSTCTHEGDYDGFYFTGSQEYSATVSKVFFPISTYRGIKKSLVSNKSLFWTNTPDTAVVQGGCNSGPLCAKGMVFDKWTTNFQMSPNKGRAIGGSVRCVKKTQ